MLGRGCVPLKRAQLKHAAPSSSRLEGISPGQGGVSLLFGWAQGPRGGSGWASAVLPASRVASPGSPRAPPPGTSLCHIFEVGQRGLGSPVGIFCLVLRWTLGVSGGAGVVSVICSTNQEFRKGNHTKCICYLKIHFFNSFFFLQNLKVLLFSGSTA